jgi:hypothetical protein
MKRPGSTLGIAALALLGLLPLAASAGIAGGPYIVWVNLASDDPSTADDAIRAAVDSEDKQCWSDDALLYMRLRPPGITDDLVRRALVRKDPAAQRSLRARLKQPFDTVPAFDGIVAYLDNGPPRLVSLSARGAIRTDAVIAGGGEPTWLETFCHVLPPVAHAP